MAMNWIKELPYILLRRDPATPRRRIYSHIEVQRFFLDPYAVSLPLGTLLNLFCCYEQNSLAVLTLTTDPEMSVPCKSPTGGCLGRSFRKLREYGHLFSFRQCEEVFELNIELFDRHLESVQERTFKAFLFNHWIQDLK